LAALERQAYGYGVGLGAYLTSALLHQPRTALWMLPKLWGGISRALGDEADPSRAPGPAGTAPSDEWARLMVRLQRKGLMRGPFAYLTSVVHGMRPPPPARHT
jgi:hypothetical protein